MMKLVNRLPVLVLVGAIGCGEPSTESDAGSATEDLVALRALDRDLRVGDRGAAVRAIHAYLERFGYFPNDDLARRYPAWRPFADAPRDRSVYDENTAGAVTALQTNLGLEESGVLDERTRRLVLQARCANPDIQDFDPSNKWELDASSWSSDSVTWRVVNAGGGVTTSEVRFAAQRAFGQWDELTKWQFTELTSGTANIMIRFTADLPVGDWDGLLAGTYVPADGGDVYFNTNYDWSAASPTPSGRYDVNSVMVHEIGHALGILHSSYHPDLPDAQRAVMYPTLDEATQNRSLKLDDVIAAQAKNIKWEEFDGASVDIDVGDGGLFHHTYVTGGAFVPGGREVWALQNHQWVLYPGQGAVRISGKGSGNVWIVQDDGDIYQLVLGSWVRRSGCAKDVAVATDGQVWIVGCSEAPGGFNIYKWRGSSWGEPATGGIGGVRISLGMKKPVDPCSGICPIGRGDQVPWIVQDDGDIYRRSSKQVDIGSWEQLPGGASDIAASPAGYTWSLGENPVTGGFRIYAWNEQDALDDGQPPPSELAKWVRAPGAARNIGTDSYGNPYVVNSFEQAFW